MSLLGDLLWGAMCVNNGTHCTYIWDVLLFHTLCNKQIYVVHVS